MKPKSTLRGTALALTLFGLLPLTAFAQRDLMHGAEAAAIRAGTKFAIPVRTGEYDVGGLATPFFFKSNGDSITSLRVCVRFDASKLTFQSFDKTSYYNWTGKADSVVQYGGGSTGYVAVFAYNVANVVFNDTLFAFKWTPKCFTDGTVDTLEWFDTLTVYDNDFTIKNVSGTWEPDTMKSGGPGIFTYTGDIYPISATISASDTGFVPILITNNFHPSDSVKATVWYNQTDLQYVGYQTADYSCLSGSGGLTVDSSANGDTLRIAWFANTGCDQTSDVDTLLKLKFWNRHDDRANTVYRDTVKVLSWRQVDCSAALAEESSPAASVVITPEFTATISIKTQSFMEDRLDSLQSQFVNNHVVDMSISTGDQNYTSLAASFHLLESALDTAKVRLKEPGYCVRPAHDNQGDLAYQWTEAPTPPAGSRIFRQGSGSDNLEIHASAYTCAFLKMDTRPVTATVKDTADLTVITDSQSDHYGKDCKLKARGRPTVIYPQNVKSDNHLTIVDGEITIVNGGGSGGSCPFVYTWGGSGYMLEDAVLTGSEKLPEGTPVVDYLPLTFTPALENGSYRVRIHEEEAEKTFLDDAELLIIDHEPGFVASVSTDGKVVFGSGRIHPVEVLDEAGRNLTDLLAAEDNQRFESGGSGSFTATFSRREGEIYALSAEDSTGYGSDGMKGPCEVKGGPLGQNKPEPTTCRIEVEDAQGAWHELPMGPSRLPKARIRPVIDLSGYDLPALFRIRYTWDGKFSLDEIALSVQVPVEHTLRKAIASGITHSSDHPSAKLAAQEDGRYAELVTGEYLDLEFPAEPVPDGMERSVVLMTKGYFLQWFGHQDAARPLAFGLNGNYPNPFNPSTTIRYSLAAEAPVRLEIFNVLGQRVRTLVADKTQPAGSYEAFWDGTNDDGQFVGSGVYLYRLDAADFVETRKMIMLK